MIRPSRVLALSVFSLLALSPARAEYPDHTVTGLVPFDAGGGADIFARLITPELSKKLGQTVVIVNKGGASGNIGMQMLAHAKPDGYTILFNGAAAAENPAMFNNLGYDPVKDVDSVAELAESPYMIAINTDRIATSTLAEFVETVRKAPGKYNVGVGGGGQQVPVALFLQQNNLQVQVVPYKGTGPTTTALLAGEIDFAILAPGPLAQVASSGKVRLLANTGDERSPKFPDVPTTSELGMPDYHVADSYGVYIPKGTPPVIAQQLNTALNEVMAEPEVAGKFRALGFAIVHKTAEQSSKSYLDEVALWKDVAAKAHIPPQD